MSDLQLVQSPDLAVAWGRALAAVASRGVDEVTPLVVNVAGFEGGFPDAPPNPNTVYTVTYKKGGDQGSLVAGGSIAVKPGTIFNVTATDKS